MRGVVKRPEAILRAVSRPPPIRYAGGEIRTIGGDGENGFSAVRSCLFQFE
ncbi:hypothetical protein ACSYAY_10770 [Leptospirillum ferriphilum]|uniref:hypothetical protein n=1 Tax=Leptospirillum ferriphilum TaxID=178606 RepID=UPI003EE7651D